MPARTDIICISSIDWDFIWQGHQEIMATLAAQGHRVLFLENTGVRAPQVRDFPRIRQRVRNWWRGTKGFREGRRTYVYSPLVLPSLLARRLVGQRWLLLSRSGVDEPLGRSAARLDILLPLRWRSTDHDIDPPDDFITASTTWLELPGAGGC